MKTNGHTCYSDGCFSKLEWFDMFFAKQVSCSDCFKTFFV